MADKRTYTIPLRRSFQRSQRHQRTKKAVSSVRSFLSKHMKGDDVRIGPSINELLWERGSRKPPARVTVVTEKDEDGVVHAVLEGEQLPSEIAAEEAAKDDKKAKKEAKKAKKTDEAPAEDKKAQKADEASKSDKDASEKTARQAEEKPAAQDSE